MTLVSCTPIERPTNFKEEVTRLQEYTNRFEIELSIREQRTVYKTNLLNYLEFKPSTNYQVFRE